MAVDLAVFFATPKEIIPGASYVWAPEVWGGVLCRLTDGHTLPALPEEYETIEQILQEQHPEMYQATPEPVVAPVVNPPCCDQAEPASIVPAAFQETEESVPSSQEPIARTEAWRHSRKSYITHQADHARQEIQARLDEASQKKKDDPDKLWGPGKEFRNKKEMTQGLKQLIDSVDPEHWSYEHECAVRDALATGKIAVNSPIMVDYQHLKQGPPEVHPNTSARHLIRVEYSRTEPGKDGDQPVQARAHLTLPDSTCFAGPWIIWQDGKEEAIKDAALAEFAKWTRRENSFVEMVAGQTEAGMSLTEMLHPYVIPAGRPGCVAVDGQRQFAIRPVVLPTGEIKFASQCREPGAPYEMLAMPWLVNYDAACALLAGSGILSDQAYVTDEVVKISQGFEPIEQELTVTDTAAVAFYADIQHSADKMFGEEGVLQASLGKKGESVRVKAVFFGDLALHKPLDKEASGHVITHAQSGLAIATLPSRKEAKALVFMLTSAGINWQKLSGKDKTTAKKLVESFRGKKIPDVVVFGHDRVQRSLFDCDETE